MTFYLSIEKAEKQEPHQRHYASGKIAIAGQGHKKEKIGENIIDKINESIAKNSSSGKKELNEKDRKFLEDSFNLSELSIVSSNDLFTTIKTEIGTEFNISNNSGSLFEETMPPYYRKKYNPDWVNPKESKKLILKKKAPGRYESIINTTVFDKRLGKKLKKELTFELTDNYALGGIRKEWSLSISDKDNTDYSEGRYIYDTKKEALEDLKDIINNNKISI
jgi:hypothetical protein